MAKPKSTPKKTAESTAKKAEQETAEKEGKGDTGNNPTTAGGNNGKFLELEARCANVDETPTPVEFTVAGEFGIHG